MWPGRNSAYCIVMNFRPSANLVIHKCGLPGPVSSFLRTTGTQEVYENLRTRNERPQKHNAQPQSKWNELRGPQWRHGFRDAQMLLS